jgi:hypothetical protein
MEAMTQEFTLHRRPHAEIWSARESSNDDTSEIHHRNQNYDGSQPSQPRTNKRSTSETKKIWWISTKGSTSETKNLMDPDQLTKQPHKPWDHKKSSSETKIWWIYNQKKNPKCPQSVHFRNKVNQTDDIPKHRCSSLDLITHPIKQ